MFQKWKKRMVAIIAGCMFIASSLSVLAVVQGSQENPLVTLTYLKDVFTKSILQETEKKISESKSSYEQNLDNKIAAYSEEMKNLCGSGGSDVAVFSVVNLENGKTLTASVGCEIMLRAGRAECLIAGSPGLIDITSGSMLGHGSDLVKNHLYMVTADGNAVQAVGDTVKLLVRGSYSIK